MVGIPCLSDVLDRGRLYWTGSYRMNPRNEEMST